MATTSDYKLNGLARDGLFRNLLELELKRSRRYQYFTSLLMVEANWHLLDRLGINNQGLVQRVANLLRKELRETDVVELQNDRIVTILLPYADRNSTRNVASRLSAWVSSFMGDGQGGTETHIRVGGASFPSDATDLDGLYRCAGDMLNRASFQQEGAIQMLE
jgi:GGDEF domain-containing protein